MTLMSRLQNVISAFAIWMPFIVPDDGIWPSVGLEVGYSETYEKKCVQPSQFCTLLWLIILAKYHCLLCSSRFVLYSEYHDVSAQ